MCRPGCTETSLAIPNSAAYAHQATPKTAKAGRNNRGKDVELRNGMRARGLVYSREKPQWHRRIASQAHPKPANRFQHDRTTLAVRPTKPSMDLTPRPKRYGTRQKTHRLGLTRTISRKHRSLTVPGLHRESNGRVSAYAQWNRSLPPWRDDGQNRRNARRW